MMNFPLNLTAPLLALTLIACGGAGTPSDSPATFTVTATAGTHGSISPGSATVDENTTATFTLTADSGFTIDAVIGCSGTLVGTTYVTGPITADCTITATFRTLNPPAAAASPNLSLVQVKGFRFDWTDALDATFYRLLENPDGTSGFTQSGTDIPQGTGSITLTVPLHRRLNAQYILQSCNSAGCIDSSPQAISGTLAAGIGYFKAANTGTNDRFGTSISLSADGQTLAVGSPFEDSGATGVNGDGNNDSAPDAGAVYVFTRLNDSTWAQQAYLKASNTGSGDQFGWSLNLNADGSTLAVGAPGEDSNATGEGGDQSDNSAADSGAAYIFARSGSTWTQQAYVKASNTDIGDLFGISVSLNADGSRLVIGAPGEDSSAIGIDGNQLDNSAAISGAVYVYQQSVFSATWVLDAYIKASNSGAGDRFGRVVDFDADGDTLAIAAADETSNATGVGGDQSDNSVNGAGAVYVIERSGSNWMQSAYIKASNTGFSDFFGNSISLSDAGDLLAIAAYREDSSASGIGGDQLNNVSVDAGAVYLYQRSVFSRTWVFQNYIKASNTGPGDFFGSSVNISGDGSTLAVAAALEASNAVGLNGDQNNNSGGQAGAVYVFTRDANNWTQQAYVKAGNTGSGDFFGDAVSLNSDGGTMGVSATSESSAAAGIGGDQGSNSLPSSGAVYVY